MARLVADRLRFDEALRPRPACRARTGRDDRRPRDRVFRRAPRMGRRVPSTPRSVAATGKKPPRERQRNVVIQSFTKKTVTDYVYDLPRDGAGGQGAAGASPRGLADPRSPGDRSAGRQSTTPWRSCSSDRGSFPPTARPRKGVARATATPAGFSSCSRESASKISSTSPRSGSRRCGGRAPPAIPLRAGRRASPGRSTRSWTAASKGASRCACSTSQAASRRERDRRPPRHRRHQARRRHLQALREIGDTPTSVPTLSE